MPIAFGFSTICYILEGGFKMKIGLFTDTYFPQINGVGTSVHTLAGALSRLGHEVYIFTPTDPNQPDQEDDTIIRMPSMPCIFIRQFRMGLVYSPKELAKIAHLHLDIVHTQTEFSLGIFGKILSKALNIPMIHTYHTMYEDYVHYIVNGALITPSMAKDFSKIFCNSANCVIAPTEKVKHFLNSYGVSRPIEIIPTGIHIDKFRKSNYSAEEIFDLKQELGLNPESPIILSLGRVAKEKSIHVILEAMPKLLENLPSVMLVIVGDGPARQELTELAQTLNISDHVLFTGAKPWAEIGKYYQIGDVFVSASTTETQGLTFIEAMAAGVPVVAKEDDCILDVVKNEENGLLFQKDEELSEKLLSLFQNPQKKAFLASNTLHFVETLSAETFGKNMETLYLDILENPEKYDYHKHHLVSPRRLKLAAAKKFEELNAEITNELSEQKRKLVHIASLPKKEVIKRYQKLKNRD